MANVNFSENYYSFRQTYRIFDQLLQPLTPEQAALAAIEARLVNAHNEYLARRYQAAIQAYKEAETLIYAQLNPSFPYGFSGMNGVLQLSRDPKLFEPLLSASLEWLNVLPVRQPVTMTQSRLPVDPDLLGDAVKLDAAGLLSSKLPPGNTMRAAADLQLARALTKQGNTPAGTFFTRRAEATDPDTTRLLNTALLGSDNPPVAPTPESRGAIRLPFGVDVPFNVHLNRPGTEAPDRALAERASVTLNRPSPLLASEALGTPVAELPPGITENRSVGLLSNGTLQTFQWNVGEAPPLVEMRKAVYEKRVANTDLLAVAMRPFQPSDVALNLPHNYYYVIPLGLAECYHALGQFETADSYYFQAASYQFLNAEIEAPYLWLRLATLYLDWGNFLFRQEQAPDAFPIYQRVLMADDTVPTSSLYTTPALKPGVDIATQVIASLGNLNALTVNPQVVAVIVEVRQQLIKIQGGLDFWGHWHNAVPIWTFAFLQSAAINFTQMAISAERDFINFRDRKDQGDLTRQEIVDGIAQGNAEINAAEMQAKAAKAEVQVYSDGISLADLREQNAKNAANEYAAKSQSQIMYQALSAQLGGGDDGDPNQLNGYADLMMGIATGPAADMLRNNPGARMTGSAATLSAAEQLVASRLNRDYEVHRLQSQVGEMALAALQAKDQFNAAAARQKAAEAAVNVATAHRDAAKHAMTAFDNQYFTPDVWQRMAQAMWRLYQRYLTMALRTAKLMQQAYNFENDESLHLIKSDYATDEVKGLLGADALMADIQSFTYDLITTQAGKPQPMKQTLSLA
ncbi:MAG TPA: hypothetical protein VE988_27955, partial [Gemmataceae bacterium]|nr:hypothetical protein [Gemmataceae bacterium]